MTHLNRLKSLPIGHRATAASNIVGDEIGLGVQGMTYSGEDLNEGDNALDNWYNPLLDNTVRQIAQEVAQMRIAGTLTPFIEGQPIGVLPRRIRVRPLTDVQIRKEYNKRKEEERDAMLALRKRNNTTMKSILEAM
jgi:hypothetical protein